MTDKFRGIMLVSSGIEFENFDKAKNEIIKQLDNIKKGDLVLVKSRKLDKLKLGDEIFVYRIISSNKVAVEVGKVGQIYLDEDAVSFENGDTFSNEFIIGTADKIYEKIGTYLSIVESKWGFLFLVLVPCLLIFIYEIYALIVEIKYGAEEENN